MADFYGWIAGGLGVVFAVAVAWITGRSKGKAVAQKEASEQQVRDMIAASKRETTVVREAANVDQKINSSSNADVDKQLLDKWTRK